MMKLLTYANQYMRQSDWKELALIKFCLAAMGTLIGLFIPKKGHKVAKIIAGLIFIITYIPLMTNFFRVVFKERRKQKLQEQ